MIDRDYLDWAAEEIEAAEYEHDWYTLARFANRFLDRARKGDRVAEAAMKLPETVWLDDKAWRHIPLGHLNELLDELSDAVIEYRDTYDPKS